MRHLLAMLLLMLLALPGRVASTPMPVRPACAIDSDFPSVPACAMEKHDGQPHVMQRYAHQLFAHERARLLAVLLPEIGWSYIDRHGRVVVRDVAVMDNVANAFHRGLVRVTDGNHWGLADAHGRLVVPLKYDGMLDYQPGKGWPACSGCRAASDGEHGWFDGGKFLTIDENGNVVPLH